MRKRCAGAAAVLLGCGCGGAERDAREPAATPVFSAAPALVDDFSDAGSGWPRGGYEDGVYVVSDSQSAAVLAPERVTPATRGVRADVAVRPSRGGAGLLCRASADGDAGYAVLLGADGRAQLSRIDDGGAAVLDERRLAPEERSARGEPWTLRLTCGPGAPGDPIALSYSVNGAPTARVVDAEAVDPGDEAGVGLVARDGAAHFDDFKLSLG